MFFLNVVIAGVPTVILMVLFFAGFGFFGHIRCCGNGCLGFGVFSNKKGATSRRARLFMCSFESAT